MDKILSKTICLSTLGCAFIYGLILPFCWGNDPTSPTGTLSVLCEDKQLFFWLWGLLSAGGLTLNIQYLYKKFGIKNKFLDSLCILSFLSMILVALTLGHDITTWNPKRIIHWVATGAFVIFIIASIFLFFLIYIKKFKGFGVLAVCSLSVLGVFLFMFLVIGKSGLMEIIPLSMIEIFMFIVNFTPIVKVQQK